VPCEIAAHYFCHRNAHGRSYGSGIKSFNRAGGEAKVGLRY